MRRSRLNSRRYLWVFLALAGIATLWGCPFLRPPDYSPALLVTPKQLDFGIANTTLTFQVAKSWTSRPLPPFLLTPNKPWITVDPTTGSSTGPDDPVVVTVTVDRSLMVLGPDTGQIAITALGTAQETVVVRAESALAADFSADEVTTRVGEAVNFRDESATTATAGSIQRWTWDFGDGAASSAQHPAHAYAEPGTYTVSLTVETASLSATKTRRDYIIVEHAPPNAEFTVSDRTPLQAVSVQFTDLSSPGTAPPITGWLWNFGDGVTSILRNPTHAYGVPGPYTVSLTVATSAGSDTETKADYIVVGAPPQVDFSADATFGDAPLRAQFTNLSTLGTSPTTELLWDFGDGATSSSSNPTHTYSEPGNYDVTLTVTTEDGNYVEKKEEYIKVADPSAAVTGLVNLANAIIVTRPGTLPNAESMAPVVLVEEVLKRTGIRWSTVTAWPESPTVIAITSRYGQPGTAGAGRGPELEPEGYRLFVQQFESGQRVVWVLGADPSGALYGVGKLLRMLSWAPGVAQLANAPNLATGPAVALRGHQLGYRNAANSYDAWDVNEYEQYIRELVIFGANSIENIPFTGSSPHFAVPPAEMAQRLSELCDQYDIEYWVWTPAEVDLSNPAQYAALLAQHAALYAGCVRIDGVFVPGGDPGENHPQYLFPFLEDLAALLSVYHPNAGVWVSNQQFTAAKNDYFFNYLQTEQPTWLEGVVYGPWTKMTIEEMRSRTPSQYKLRRYPDITHSVRCQYPVPARDRALAHTLGRENPNPRPVAQAHIHNLYKDLAFGFLAYSDGCHDDVNKQIWNMRGWDPNMSVDDMLGDYTWFFFGPTVAQDAADGIKGLELNEVGPLATNTGVEDTFDLWTQLEDQAPGLLQNWRWQLCLLRAYYDMYIRERLEYEEQLQENANTILAEAGVRGADTVMAEAAAELARATTEPIRQDLRDRIFELCDALFDSIGLQTSVPLYQASGPERGAILDFVDHPLNNRLWLESEFVRIAGLSTEPEKLQAIETILGWEDPGPGGFYDDLGNAAKEPRLVYQKSWAEDPGFVESTQDEFQWNKFNWRLSWQDQAQTLYGTPLELHYEGLDTVASYRLEVLYTGRFNPTMTLTADGSYTVHGALAPPSPPQVLGFDLPAGLTSDGVLDLVWDLVDPALHRGCQVAEVWLIKQ